jgi:hypothetical protein
MFGLKMGHNTSIGGDVAHVEVYPFICNIHQPASFPEKGGEFD